MIDLLEYKNYYGTVEYSAEDNILFGKVVGINSLISYEGDSLASLKADFESAVDDYLEMCKAENIEPEKRYIGSLNVQISPTLHKNLALFAAAHNQTLNAVVETAIRNYVSGA